MKSILFKIYFLFLILNIQTELTLDDDKPLDLVTDDQLYYDHNFFDQGSYQDNLNKLSDSYKKCLQKNGVKEESFNKCVGKRYSKLDRELMQQLQQTEATLKEAFAHNLSPLCKNDNIVLCSDLIDSLNMSFVRFENPVPGIQKQSEEFNLSGKDERKLTEVIKKLENSYKDYQNSEYLMHQTRDRTLHDVKNYIEQTHVNLDYDINFDSISSNKTKEIKEKLENTDFHSDMVKRVNSDVLESFKKLNGPLIDDENHQIIVL